MIIGCNKLWRKVPSSLWIGAATDANLSNLLMLVPLDLPPSWTLLPNLEIYLKKLGHQVNLYKMKCVKLKRHISPKKSHLFNSQTLAHLSTGDPRQTIIAIISAQRDVEQIKSYICNSALCTKQSGLPSNIWTSLGRLLYPTFFALNTFSSYPPFDWLSLTFSQLLSWKISTLSYHGATHLITYHTFSPLHRGAFYLVFQRLVHFVWIVSSFCTLAELSSGLVVNF